MEEYWKEGMKERRDERKKGCRKAGVKESIDAGKERFKR